MPDTPDAVAALQASNSELRALNEDLRAENAELRARLAQLERLIARNSGNSSMPPGTDDLPGRKPPAPKPRRGGGKRKPGKQPGAPGAHLEWNDHPDRTRDVFPAGGCACGADLSGAADLGVRYSHQVTDLPGVRAQTIQYDRHAVACSCGRRHVADAPPEAAGAPGTVTYGLNFQAWCVFLLVMQHVPVERCADIIESMSGTRPSDGWVHGLLARAAAAVAVANKAIRALIILARVICGDETPLRAGPGPKRARSTCWSPAPACSRITFPASGTCPRSGTSSTATCTAPSSSTTGTRTTTPSPGSVTSCAQPTCSATSRTPPSPTRTRSGPPRSPANCAPSSTPRIPPATGAWTRCPPRQPASTCACSGKASPSGCLTCPVPPRASNRPPGACWNACATAKPTSCGSSPTPPSPTSNQAERDLRPAKTQQKISGRLRSDKTTRDRYAVRGYASTAAKHGQHIFTAIRDALAGTPWIPPVPATA